MFYRVNMSTLTVSIDEGARYQGLGGRVLCQRIIQTEAALDAHPLSERNKLIFAAGLLSGTGAAGVGRLFLGAKSPLTNHVTESSAGGGMDNKLGRLGIQGIILEGMAKKSAYILHISSQGAILQEVPELRGLNIFAAVKSLKKSYAGKPSIGCIGTAGENKLLTACIGFTDWQGNSTRQAGRGGLGAVMGSKGLKAIVVDDSEAGKVFLADEKAFAAGAKKLASSLLAVYGKTANESGASLQAGCLPGCIISCPKRNNTKNQQGALFKSVLGEILGTNSFEKIADINRLCDDYGVDIMEFSKAVSLAIKAGVLEAGSSQGVIDLVQQLGQNTLLGRVIGSGMEIAGKVFGVFSIDTKQSSHKSSKDTALTAGLIDSMGLCNAITGVLRDNPEGLEGVIEMCNARYGWHKSLHEYLELSR